MNFLSTVRDYITRSAKSDRTDTVLTGSYVSQGEIDVRNYKTLVIFPKWTKGDETSAEIKITVLYTSGGTEHQQGVYTNSSGTLSQLAQEYQYTSASTNAVPIELDVTGFVFIKIYTKATGGTPTGKMKIDYIVSNSN